MGSWLSVKTFLTDWFMSGKPRRAHRHTHTPDTRKQRLNRLVRRRRPLFAYINLVLEPGVLPKTQFIYFSLFDSTSIVIFIYFYTPLSSSFSLFFTNFTSSFFPPPWPLSTPPSIIPTNLEQEREQSIMEQSACCSCGQTWTMTLERHLYPTTIFDCFIQPVFDDESDQPIYSVYTPIRYHHFSTLSFLFIYPSIFKIKEFSIEKWKYRRVRFTNLTVSFRNATLGYTVSLFGGQTVNVSQFPISILNPFAVFGFPLLKQLQ